MEGSVEADGEVDHLFRAGNAAGFAAKASEPMPLRHVVALNQMRFALCLGKQFWWDQIGVRAPIIREEHLHIPVLQSFVKPCKCSIIAPSALPVDKLMGIAAISLPYPEFVFFELR